MGGELAACVWTDPPYGVDYVGKTKRALTVRNDGADESIDTVTAVLLRVRENITPGSPFYLAAPPGPQGTAMRLAVAEAGWMLHEELVWVKDQFVLGHSDYHYRHEPILYGYLPGPGRRGRGGDGWYGDHAQDTVFEVPRPTASPDHPTTKPVGLVTAMLANSTNRGDLVLDPFGGSGTTLIACAELGRVCRMVELAPNYCDVIVRRWETATGQAAVRIPAGTP